MIYLLHKIKRIKNDGRKRESEGADKVSGMGWEWGTLAWGRMGGNSIGERRMGDSQSHWYRSRIGASGYGEGKWGKTQRPGMKE